MKEIMNKNVVALVAVSSLSLAACGGGTPPPKTEEATPAATGERPKKGPTVEQELGSIDQRAVEKKFADLQGKLQACHTKGRDRVDFLAGDVKVFLRIGKDGKVRYGWFEESTLGDRATEKCILDTFAAADWPKPEGGEAEVRNGFGWPAGNERQPANWGPEKAMLAVDDDKDAKKAIAQCKAGVSGDFRVTAYVEPGDADDAPVADKGKHAKDHHGAHKKAEKAATHAPGKQDNHGGRFKAIGVAAPNKEGAEKVDCIVDALKNVSLPSPGSYAAKVTFPI